MSIRERLKTERGRLGLSQTRVAELLGVGKTTVINWEKGSSAPDAVQLSALATAGVDVLYVVTGESCSVIEPPPLPLPQLPADEQMWLNCYQGWDQPIKQRELARALGLVATGEPERDGLSKGETHTQQTFHGAVRGGVAGRDIVQTGKAGKR